MKKPQRHRSQFIVRRPQLDGLRFILFLLVFTVHYWPKPIEINYFSYALPVFFVMSGFLITNVLLSAEEANLTSKLRAFYVRRFLRICPAYFLVVVILMAMGLLALPGYHLTYLVNVLVFDLSWVQPGDPLSPILYDWRRQSLHLWSLSVEEQFYIIYPLLLFLAPARYRVPMLFAILLGSIASRFLFRAYLPQTFYGALLPLCAEYLVWGCLFAWWEARGKLTNLPPVLTFNLSLLAIFALIGTEYYLGNPSYFQFRTTHWQTPIALAMGFFLWALWNLESTHPAVRFLSWKPFVYFGGMSYTLYLVHLMAPEVFQATGIELPFSPRADAVIGSLVVTFLMAIAIWHLWEKPIYSLRRHFPVSKSEQHRGLLASDDLNLSVNPGNPFGTAPKGRQNASAT